MGGRATTGYTVIDRLRTCADRSESTEAERAYFMMAVRVRRTRDSRLQSCGCRRIAYGEETCVSRSLRRFEEL